MKTQDDGLDAHAPRRYVNSRTLHFSFRALLDCGFLRPASEPKQFLPALNAATRELCETIDKDVMTRLQRLNAVRANAERGQRGLV